MTQHFIKYDGKSKCYHKTVIKKRNWCEKIKGTVRYFKKTHDSLKKAIKKRVNSPFLLISVHTYMWADTVLCL